MVAADGVPLGRDAPTVSPHNGRRFAVCSAVSGEAGIGLVGIADLADRWNDADRAFQNRVQAVFMEKNGFTQLFRSRLEANASRSLSDSVQQLGEVGASLSIILSKSPKRPE